MLVITAERPVRQSRASTVRSGSTSRPTTLSSCIRDKNSTMIGAISSSYDDEVSMKVYRTAAATRALFLTEELNSSCHSEQLPSRLYSASIPAAVAETSLERLW